MSFILLMVLNPKWRKLHWDHWKQIWLEDMWLQEEWLLKSLMLDQWWVLHVTFAKFVVLKSIKQLIQKYSCLWSTAQVIFVNKTKPEENWSQIQGYFLNCVILIFQSLKVCSLSRNQNPRNFWSNSSGKYSKNI